MLYDLQAEFHGFQSLHLLLKYPALSFADEPKCDMLFRRYVSRCAAGKGRAVLEGVGLDSEAKEMCYKNHALDEEEAVQTGLTKWRNVSGDTATWEVLLSSMKYAEIGVQHINNLKQEVLKGADWQRDVYY